MRKIINLINRKISALLGTSRIKDLFELQSRYNDVATNKLIDDYLDQYLYKNPKYSQSKRITSFHKSIYTQNGEDGIIEEIFNRIGSDKKTFVEFGVHGFKNNSTYLLTKGWSGFWIGGNNEAEAFINSRFLDQIKANQLKFIKSWITRDNIEEIFRSHGIPEEFDFLSIDLDGNDYWIWKAINAYKPRVVCIEYNATFPPNHSWIMKYNENHQWKGDSYFGASLKAMENLGNEKGYTLIGCDFAGCNAFFVRQDIDSGKFESPFTAENHYETPKYFLKRPTGHPQGWGPFVSE